MAVSISVNDSLHVFMTKPGSGSMNQNAVSVALPCLWVASSKRDDCKGTPIKPGLRISPPCSANSSRDKKGRVSAALRSSSFGAGNRTRTGDIDLGKVALYQLSYARATNGEG